MLVIFEYQFCNSMSIKTLLTINLKIAYCIYKIIAIINWRII